MSFSQALFNDTLRLRWRILAGGIFALTMYVGLVLQYDWKSAWLPPLVAIAAAFILRWRRLGLLMAIGSYVPVQIMSSQAIASDEYSYSTRLDAWAIVLEMLKVNPILGFGPANYYWYTPLFRIRGYAVRFNSHNQYLDILAQTGILGLLCVLWFFVEIGWLGWQLLDRAPKGFARAYIYGALGGLAGTAASGMLVDWFLPFAYNIGLNGFRSSVLAWIFLGGLVSIEQIARYDVQAKA
jgi:O-antigen ligase